LLSIFPVAFKLFARFSCSCKSFFKLIFFHCCYFLTPQTPLLFFILTLRPGFSKNLEGVPRGTIQIVAEEMLESKEEALLQFSGRKLDKINWLWFKSDPFIEISR
jgi:hypothetical protein